MAKRPKKTDYPFGIYKTEATLTFEDELDLNHHMNESDWDKLSESQRKEKLIELTEADCIGDIDYEHKFDRKTDE
jgi:hypothetical protein